MSRASALYEGYLQHHRRKPRVNRFRYRIFFCWLDLDELPTLFEGMRLWQVERPGWAVFRRRDHLGPLEVPLAEAVRDLVAERRGFRPAGPVRMLTHLRYLGYLFNPVSFYYCYDQAGDAVEAIVAEVHNTPWHEEFCYVLDTRDQQEEERFTFKLDKSFHVSPFLPMDLHYRWLFSPPGERLTVTMEDWREQNLVFDVHLMLARREMTSAALNRTLLRYPCMTAKVTAAIYWQALRLALKRVPFYSHPEEHWTRWKRKN